MEGSQHGEMTFKTRHNTYCIELSPTSRARCRRCRHPIALGATRLRITAFVRPNRATSFFRCTIADCLADHGLATAVIAACGSPEPIPCSDKVSRDSAAAVRTVIAAAACGSEAAVHNNASACVQRRGESRRLGQHSRMVGGSVMNAPADTDRSKVKVSTGNAQTDKIIENAQSIPTLGDMAAHFYRMHRMFDAKHKAALSISNDGIRKDVATQALGDRADPRLSDTEDEGGELSRRTA
jgi:hypothetical protein